jgi:hypothetical protein
MTNPNTDVWLSLLRSVVKVLCGMLITKGLLSATDAPIYQTALETLLPSIVAAAATWWGARTQTPAAKVVAADAIPGVTVTANKETAPAAVVEVAKAQTNDIKLTG